MQPISGCSPTSLTQNNISQLGRFLPDVNEIPIQNPMNLTRQQHYVWSHYLEGWEVNGKLQVSRHRGVPFSVPATKITKQRDFYRLPRLDAADFEFIRGNIEFMGLSEIEKKTAYGWLKPLVLIESVERQFIGKDMPSELRSIIDEIEIESEEKFHSATENESVDTLRKLRNDDCAFWKVGGKEAMEFAFFISLQLLRTKRMADNVVDGAYEALDKGMVERTWPYLKFIFASNIGKSLYLERSKWSLHTVDAGGDRSFITSDQPVMNLLKPDNHNGMALYYPLSPRKALLIEHDDNERLFGLDRILTDDAVHALNARLSAISHELIIADNLAALSEHGAAQKS